MILFIQCVVCCLLFTLAILPTQYKDPINMIMSYPPKIRQRVEELPQYKETIKQRGKIHIGKKILGLIFFVIILSSVAYLSGCRSFNTTFTHVFVLFFVVKILQFPALTLCNSANGGKALIFRRFRHLPCGRVLRISQRIPA